MLSEWAANGLEGTATLVKGPGRGLEANLMVSNADTALSGLAQATSGAASQSSQREGSFEGRESPVCTRGLRVNLGKI